MNNLSFTPSFSAASTVCNVRPTNVTRPGFWGKYCSIVCALLVLSLASTTRSYAVTRTGTLGGTALVASNECQGSANVLVYSYSIAQTNTANAVEDFMFTTTAGATTTVSSYYVYIAPSTAGSLTAVPANAYLLGSVANSGVGTQALTDWNTENNATYFPLTVGKTYYVYITANILATATVGSTVAVTAPTTVNTNFTWPGVETNGVGTAPAASTFTVSACPCTSYYSYTGGPATTGVGSGAVQIYTVPTGCSNLNVTLAGSRGGDGEYTTSRSIGGNGGMVAATLSVTSGTALQVYVGNVGNSAIESGLVTTNGPGGSNSGGGAVGGIAGLVQGGGGGGESDIRGTAGATTAALNSRVVMGGAGGGATYVSVDPGLQTSNGGIGAYGGGAGGGDGQWDAGYVNDEDGNPGTFSCCAAGVTPGGGETSSPGALGAGGAGVAPWGSAGGGGGYYGASGSTQGAACGGSSYAMTVAGVATVSATTYTDGNNTGAGYVTITPIFTVTGTTGICAGNSAVITLSGSVSGATYSLYNGATLISSTAGTGSALTYTVTPAVTTTYTINATQPSVNMAGSATITILTASPAAINGNTGPICVGSTLNLTDASAGGTWSSAAITVATVTASGGVVSGVGQGTSIISYTTGCGTPAETTVTVIAAPSAITGGDSVCEGSNVTLADAATGGTWSSTATGIATVTAGGIVSGVGGGTSVISYITGCGAAALTVTVGIPPAAITGPSAVCMGGTITLANTSAGGIWTSSNAAIAGIGSLSGVVTGNVAGSVTITYTTPSCTPAYYIVTVNAYSGVIVGPTEVCIDGTITLADFTAGGTWSSSAPGTASITGTTATTANVYGNAAGLATIFYNFAGCAVNYVITVNPLPDAITGSPTVCLGSNITVADASGAGTWNSNDVAIASVVAGTGVVTGNELGSANITYTNTASGCFIFSTETVDPNPGAISGPTSVCNGATITLNDGGGGTWSSFAPAIASVVSTGLVTGNAAGNTTISYILSTGCYAIQAVTVNPIPAPITGSSSACTGDSSTLADITSGGTWSSAAYWIASIGSSSGEIVGLTSGGTTTISYTLGTGCFVTFIDTVVTGPSHILGDTTICVTNTSVLSDSVSGGMWHSSAPGSLSITASNGDILAVAPGVVAITYSVVGCPSVSRNVTVNPIPSPIVGTGNLCDSIHLDLYDFTPGGVWSSSDSITARIVNYPDSGVAIGVSLGETTISYTFSTGCSAILPVTVNPIAPPISGTDTICSTGNAWLTDIVGGGIWSSSNPAIASITTDSGYLAGIVPGVSFIIYTLPTGCYATLLETVVPPVPAILGAPQVCSGSIIDMTDVDSGGTWSSANNYIADVVDTSGVLSGLYHGNVTISYTVSAFKGCYATTSVVVNPLPTPVITYNPGEYQSVSTFNYYTSYQWYNDRTGLIPGGIQDTLFLPGYNDSIYVTVTDTNGCTSSTDWFYNQSTAVKNVSNANNINIYPNPANDVVYIESGMNVRAVISDMDGKTALDVNDAKQVNISKLANGVYFISLYGDDGQRVMVEKLVKE